MAKKKETIKSIKKTEEIQQENTNSLTKKIEQTFRTLHEDMTEKAKGQRVVMDEMREGVKNTFADLQSKAKNTRDTQAKNLSDLIKNLDGAFHRIHKDNQHRESDSKKLIKSLGERIHETYEKFHDEQQQYAKENEKYWQHEHQYQEKNYRKARWYAIPGVILGICAIFYMVHVVNIMKTAMSSMSNDMTKMQASMETMSGEIVTMSQDTRIMSGSMKPMSQDMHAMNTNMKDMSQNVGSMTQDTHKMSNNMSYMTRDIGLMSSQVTPTMDAMRQMMPWQ